MVSLNSKYSMKELSRNICSNLVSHFNSHRQSCVCRTPPVILRLPNECWNDPFADTYTTYQANNRRWTGLREDVRSSWIYVSIMVYNSFLH